MKSTFALAALAITSVTANDNGLAITPPLGWRSWNLFGNVFLHQLRVLQQQIELVKHVILDFTKTKANTQLPHANNAVLVSFLILLAVDANFVHLGNLVMPEAFLVICASWVNIKVRKVNNRVVSVTKESTLT